MAKCPCCSKLDFENCCEPYLKGEKKAPTAEALMRSRYSAFVEGNIDYIVNTIHPRERQEGDEDSARNWSQNSEWHGLEILATEGGAKGDTKGTVEFIASYTQEGELENHHELAKFEKLDGSWYFADAKLVGKEPYVRPEPKIGRNDPCSCGSGKKYKKCCGK